MACKLTSSNLGAILESRKRYKDHEKAPVKMRMSPLENANIAPAPASIPPLLPPDNNVSPPKAKAHPTHTLLETDCPVPIDNKGVMITEVCVKKDARAEATLRRPTLTNPCARKFQSPNSIPAIQRFEVEFSCFLDDSFSKSESEPDDTARKESLLFVLSVEVVEVVASAVLVVAAAVLVGLHNKRGTKQAEASHPLVVLSAAAVGGESN
mmetsp:Transcript_14085/g.34120  ORF Transcript_14085/g.34120 Transcript_14085/m.34120 type:complete len:210 (+) Transcript_14085:777-1406(+)